MDEHGTETGRRPVSTGTRISLVIAIFFILAAVTVVVIVNLDMKKLALENAISETRHFLDHNLAIHTYYTHQLKPSLFDHHETCEIADTFDPTWMSSTYAVREITKYTKGLNEREYYYKECAINARSPENEADELEARFIKELNADPDVIEQSELRMVDGEQYLLTLRRGEMLEESCLRCHATPAEAPPGLVDVYGPKRSFGRNAGEVVSAISVRIPLSVAFKFADEFSLKLSAVLLLILLLLFAGQYMLSKRMLYMPLAAIQDKAVAIAWDAEHLGESVPVPPGGDLMELAKAFNVMSINLRNEREQLEERVESRTAELTQANETLEREVRDRLDVEADLRRSRNTARALINAPMDTAVMLDPDGTVQAINTIGAARLGHQPNELVGKVIFDFFSPEVAEPRRKVIQEVLTTGKWQQLIDERDGRCFETSVFPVVDDDSTVTQIAVYARDVTDQQNAERVLREHDRKEAELAAIQLTAATSAHEINNPLQGITGTLQLLREQISDPDSREMITDAMSAAQRIRDVIKKLEQVKDPQYKPYLKDKQIIDLE